MFQWISRPGTQNLALVSTEINGIETACISRIDRGGNDYSIQPLAVLVNNDIFPMLEEPGAE